MPPPVPGRSKQPSPKRPLPSPFGEPTRALPNDDVISSARSGPGPGRSLFDEPTRLGDVDADLLSQSRPEPTTGDAEYPPKFLPASTELAQFDDDEATRMANVDGIARKYPPPPRSGGRNEERTRAVDIRTDPAINDIDWDID